LHGNAGNTDFNTIFDYAKHFRYFCLFLFGKYILEHY